MLTTTGALGKQWILYLNRVPDIYQAPDSIYAAIHAADLPLLHVLLPNDDEDCS